MRNPPASPVIATYAYLGPTIVPCGNPTLAIVNDNTGSSLPFLTATFDSVSKNIAIALPNKSIAVKGTYALRAVFTLPGAFSFSLGLSLTVFDVCDSSTFDSAPALAPDNQYYYIGQGDLVVRATYTDSVSRTTSNVCGPYTIIAGINSASSSIIGGPINTALTYDTSVNATHFKFFSNQPGLSGVLKHDVQISSGAFTTLSPGAVWTVNVLNCNQKYRDWVIEKSPV